MAPTAYSVSPLRTLNRVGGKNSEKRSTRMPTAFATVKCPSSCSTISSTIPKIVRSQLIVSVWQAKTLLRAAHRGLPCSRQRHDEVRGGLPCPAVGLIQRLERTDRLAGQL